jgi:hypothetical protein
MPSVHVAAAAADRARAGGRGSGGKQQRQKYRSSKQRDAEGGRWLRTTSGRRRAGLARCGGSGRGHGTGCSSGVVARPLAGETGSAASSRITAVCPLDDARRRNPAPPRHRRHRRPHNLDPPHDARFAHYLPLVLPAGSRS